MHGLRLPRQQAWDSQFPPLCMLCGRKPHNHRHERYLTAHPWPVRLLFGPLAERLSQCSLRIYVQVCRDCWPLYRFRLGWDWLGYLTVLGLALATAARPEIWPTLPSAVLVWVLLRFTWLRRYGLACTALDEGNITLSLPNQEFARAVAQREPEPEVPPLQPGADSPMLALPQELPPLLRAVRDGEIELVRQALARGEAVDGELSALHVAAISGSMEVARLLLDHPHDLEARWAGSTPLMLAVIFTNSNLAGLLLSRGADARATDPQGRTVLDHARRIEGRPGQQMLNILGSS
ncbi:MAG: ankyrin repeat domain-containing protein [Vulcanimicrobiota bacterium]